MDLAQPLIAAPASTRADGGKRAKRNKQKGEKNHGEDQKLASCSNKTSATQLKGQQKSAPINGLKKGAEATREASTNVNKAHGNTQVPHGKTPLTKQADKTTKPTVKPPNKLAKKLANRQSDLEILSSDTQEYRNMIESYPIEKLASFMQEFGLGDPNDYALLSSEILVKEIDDFYYCVLCCKRRRIESQRTIDEHLESKQHVEEYLKLKTKLSLTPPKEESIHSVAASMLFDSWINHDLMTEQGREARTLAISEFGNILVELSPECSYRILGSFLTGASRKDSDVNLELLHPNSRLFISDPRARDSIHHKLVDPDAEYGFQINHHTLHYDMIGNAVDSLHKIATSIAAGHKMPFSVISNVEDLTSKIPELVLEHVPTKILLRVCCYAESNYKLTCLLRNYSYLDDRTLHLIFLVKHWAQLCRIANPRYGTLSSDTLFILVIHFLQRTEPPVLPCLHELLKKKISPKTHQEPNELLEDQLSALSLNASSHGIDKSSMTDNLDPREGNGDENEETDLPGNEVLEEEDDEEICSEFDMTSIENLNWSSKNTDSVGRLFINFLKFTMIEFSLINKVISIRTLEPVTMQSKHWNTQVKAVENPVQPKINLTRTIGSMQTFEYIRKCFAYAYYYLTSIPLRNQSSGNPMDYSKLYINLRKFDFYFSMKESQFKTANKSDTLTEMVQQDLFARDVETIRSLMVHFINNKRELDLIPTTVFKSYDTRHLIPADFNATIFCWFCKRNGHKRDECSERIVDEQVDTNFDYLLDERVNFDYRFLKLYTEDMISPEEAGTHDMIIRELEQTIREGLKLDCLLELFGSSANLLGSNGSDLDVCMTLRGNPTGRDVNCVTILERVSKVLAENPNATNIEPILVARVPIIKLVYKGYDIDLCMYNQCAIHNSRLLRTYVGIDYRLAQLYYLVKRLAKACDIADASKGSLSSYAWSLLVIHFMQQTSPPMLPVLQESLDDKPKKMLGVSGWNVWFNDDLSSIAMPERSISLTSLFKEFLLYYTRFDFRQQVVSIRTSQKITKFEKNWHNCIIAIEDPFELTYNLSGRLDDQMATYILKSFPRAYQHICRIQNKCWSQNDTYPQLHTVKAIFVGSSIMRQPPPYRGCRRCHKIGHRVIDCPIKLINKKGPNLKAPKEKVKAN